jgi:hypothetical protein
MNATLLRERFAMIGRSIKDEESILKRTLTDKAERVFLIAKFGIGFITALMVSSEIFISTKYENERQINLRISDVESSFEYTDTSLSERSKEAVGTTIRLMIMPDFRHGKKRAIELLDATRTYLRHAPHVRVLRNGKRIELLEDWNVSNCHFTQRKSVPFQFELRLGACNSDGSFVASNAGFLIQENPEALLPYYLPRWIVGEINFWPGVVDLNVARDSIIANERAEELKVNLRQLLHKFLLDYVKERLPSFSEPYNEINDRFRNLLLLYYHAHTQTGALFDPPLLSKEQTIEILLDVIHLPFGRNEERQSLRNILSQVLRSGKSTAYTYFRSSSYPVLHLVIRWLKGQGYFVFEHWRRRTINLYGVKGNSVEISEFTVLQPVLKEFGIDLTELDDLAPEKIGGLVFDVNSLPPRIRSQLASAQRHGNLTLVGIPDGDLAFKLKDTLYLNTAHPAFERLIEKLKFLPEDTLRAYLLGLTQQSIQRALFKFE